MTFNRFAARGMIVTVQGRRIPTFYAEFKTGFNFATAMATKHFITEGSMTVTHMKMSPCWTRKILGMGPFQALSDNYRTRTQSIDLCFAKLVCVSRNWFVF